MAAEYSSGWWFESTRPPASNLNGEYYRPGEYRKAWHGIIWVADEPLKETEMKIRAEVFHE